jgi:endogenous inhibitor of DNA gyrase (YacG/DUF329 family)
MTEEKPCPRCIGAIVTWGNADNFHFCHDHHRDIMRSFSEKIASATNAKQEEPAR